MDAITKIDFTILLIVTKKSVYIPDPEAAALKRKLVANAFTDVNAVRQGKYFEIRLAAKDEAEAREKVEEMAYKLLANQYIEKHEIVSILPG